MSRPPLYPLTFTPVLKDYIWGGRNLQTKLGRELPPGTVIAESWEIAAHPNGDVAVANGPLAGQSLAALFETYGEALVGRRAAWASRRGRFPLLVKLLDAHRKLSVQVHPDDDFAREHEGDELGKSEMWVVLHAEPGAELILGVRPGATREQFREAIAAGALEPWLHHLPVEAGDFVCVPAGSLHAILGGLLIAEIQQNSDTTYRIFDWNRAGDGGKPRPLHVDEALAVINFEQVAPSLPAPRAIAGGDGIQRWELCRTPYFVVERLTMAAGATWHGECDGESLEIWGVIQGEAGASGGGLRLPLRAVQFALVPATAGSFAVRAAVETRLLRTYLPAGS
jgi:mannose-6-phosphate isomerase